MAMLDDLRDRDELEALRLHPRHLRMLLQPNVLELTLLSRELDVLTRELLRR